MATYIVDSTGSNDAEITGDFTTDAIAHTVTFNAGTDGEVLPLKALETTKQWLIVEVIEVGGTAGVIGKHVYSEDVTDIQTRVETIRQEMVALHSSFIINCTHYKTNSAVDVYRGDEATAVFLDALDTNTTFTPPASWKIDDLTPFAPTTPESSTNIIIDEGCDDAGLWTLYGGWAVSGSKLNGNTIAGQRAYPDINDTLIEGASYELSIDCESFTQGTYRFYIGNTSGSYLNGTGTKSSTIVCPTGATSVSIQGSGDLVAVFDNIKCVRV